MATAAWACGTPACPPPTASRWIARPAPWPCSPAAILTPSAACRCDPGGRPSGGEGRGAEGCPAPFHCGPALPDRASGSNACPPFSPSRDSSSKDTPWPARRSPSSAPATSAARSPT
ncbi:hypothetical protein D9599_02905 [Roseomonas sp. KE2513]|nr:hypothetical protein [Roseomonas sp. KE2513]